MLTLLGALRPERYTPRCFVVAATDRLGASKAQAFEERQHQRQWQHAQRVRGGGVPHCQSSRAGMRMLVPCRSGAWLTNRRGRCCCRLAARNGQQRLQ